MCSWSRGSPYVSTLQKYVPASSGRTSSISKLVSTCVEKLLVKVLSPVAQDVSKYRKTSLIETMVIGCCLTSDILWSFLMTVLPAEIIRPSFFHINVLRSKSIIAVDDVDEDDEEMGYDDDDNGWS